MRSYSFKVPLTDYIFIHKHNTFIIESSVAYKKAFA